MSLADDMQTLRELYDAACQKEVKAQRIRETLERCIGVLEKRTEEESNQVSLFDRVVP